MNDHKSTKILYKDRFVATEDIHTMVRVCWAAPFTGGNYCVIPKGTVLVALRDQTEGASTFDCSPENYKELEKNFVPASDRFELKYSGYLFVLSSLDVGENYSLYLGLIKAKEDGIKSKQK